MVLFAIENTLELLIYVFVETLLSLSHMSEQTFRYSESFRLDLIWYSVPVCVQSHFSHVQLFATPWTVACQAPLSMGFSRQEYWSGLLCPPPGLQGIFPTQGSNPHFLCLLHWQVGFFFFLTTSATWEAHNTADRKRIIQQTDFLNQIACGIMYCHL